MLILKDFEESRTAVNRNSTRRKAENVKIILKRPKVNLLFHFYFCV
jgi:hypothetical protein